MHRNEEVYLLWTYYIPCLGRRGPIQDRLWTLTYPAILPSVEWPRFICVFTCTLSLSLSTFLCSSVNSFVCFHWELDPMTEAIKDYRNISFSDGLVYLCSSCRVNRDQLKTVLSFIMITEIKMIYPRHVGAVVFTIASFLCRVYIFFARLLNTVQRHGLYRLTLNCP